MLNEGQVLQSTDSENIFMKQHVTSVLLKQGLYQHPVTV